MENTNVKTSNAMVATDWQGIVNYYQGKNLKTGDLVLHNAKVELSDNGLSLSFVGNEGNTAIMGINVFDVDDVEIIDEMKWVEEIFQEWENNKRKLNELLNTFEGRFVVVTAKSTCDIEFYIENFNYYINDKCNTLQFGDPENDEGGYRYDIHIDTITSIEEIDKLDLEIYKDGGDYKVIVKTSDGLENGYKADIIFGF